MCKLVRSGAVVKDRESCEKTCHRVVPKAPKAKLAPARLIMGRNQAPTPRNTINIVQRDSRSNRWEPGSNKIWGMGYGCRRPLYRGQLRLDYEPHSAALAIRMQ